MKNKKIIILIIAGILCLILTKCIFTYCSKKEYINELDKVINAVDNYCTSSGIIEKNPICFNVNEDNMPDDLVEYNGKSNLTNLGQIIQNNIDYNLIDIANEMLVIKENDVWQISTKNYGDSKWSTNGIKVTKGAKSNNIVETISYYQSDSNTINNDELSYLVNHIIEDMSTISSAVKKGNQDIITLLRVLKYDSKENMVYGYDYYKNLDNNCIVLINNSNTSTSTTKIYGVNEEDLKLNLKATNVRYVLTNDTMELYFYIPSGPFKTKDFESGKLYPLASINAGIIENRGE